MTVSVLIHYFTLVAVMWMGAEAVLMIQKIVIVFVQVSTCYLIAITLICWCMCGKKNMHAIHLTCLFCTSSGSSGSSRDSFAIDMNLLL